MDLSTLFQRLFEILRDWYGTHKEKRQIETEITLLFMFLNDSDRIEYLLKKIMQAVEIYKQNMLYDVLKSNLTEILSGPVFEIEESDREKRVNDILIILGRHFKDIHKDAIAENVGNDLKQLIALNLNEGKDLRIIKDSLSSNSSSNSETISQIDERLRYESKNRLNLKFFDFDDPIFRHQLYSAIETQGLVVFNIVCATSKEEALYYTLFLLREKHLEDHVLVITNAYDWERISPYPNTILIATFENALNATTKLNCINIRITEYTSSIEKGKNNDKEIVLPMRNTNTLRKALMDVINDDIYVNQILSKTNGYYPLIAAELIAPSKYYSWDSSLYNDLEYLEQILFLEQFSSSDSKTINSLGYNIDNILTCADRLNIKNPNYIPVYLKHKKNDENNILYRVTSPEKLWNYCLDRDSKFSTHYYSYLIKILNNYTKMDARQINITVYCLIRNSGSLSEEFTPLMDVIPQVLENASYFKQVLPAITELNPKWTLDWFNRHQEEICDDNAYSIALLIKTKATASKMIDLLLEVLNESNTSKRAIFPCLYDIAGEIFRLCTTTTPLSIQGLIERIDRIKCISLFLDVFNENILTKTGVYWRVGFIPYKYKSMDVDSRKRRSERAIIRLHNAIVCWYLKHSDFDHLLTFLGKVTALDDIEPTLIEQAIRRVCSGEAISRILKMKCLLINLFIQEKEDNPILSKTLLNLSEQLVSESKILNILPYFSQDCYFNLCKEWETDFDTEKDSSFNEHITTLIKEQNISSTEYLSAAEYINADYNRNLYIKLYLDIFGIKAISPSLISSLPNTIRPAFVEHIWGMDKNYLEDILIKMGSEELEEILNEAYPEIALQILSLVDISVRQKYWTEYHGYYHTSDKNTISVFISNLKEAGNIEGLLCFFNSNNLYMNPEMIFDILTFLDNTGQDIEKKRIPLLPFTELREASEKGAIPFLAISDLEIKFLDPQILCQDNTFFFRRINEDPVLYCKIVTGAFSNSDNMEYFLTLFLRIHTCPGKSKNGEIDENTLRTWISNFIEGMKKNGREDLISKGLAQILAWSVSEFDEMLPELVCRVIEEYSDLLIDFDISEDNSLASELRIAIHNRQGSHSSDRGERAIQISIKFDSYYRICKEKGFEQTATIYKSLSDMFNYNAIFERDQPY